MAKRCEISRAKKEAGYLQRAEIIAPLFKRGYSYREIREEVMKRLELKSYALGTVKSDIDTMLKEWQEYRLTSIDANIQLELQRIDDLVKEAWGAWEKSKEDYKKTRMRQDRVPNGDGDGSSDGGDMPLVFATQTTENMVECGDPRYIDTINKLLQERRKLLGLYAPNKQIQVGTTNVKVNGSETLSVKEMEDEIKRLMMGE